jgi:prevent-host-death family protein
MQKTISAMKARQNLGQIMNEVSLRGDDFVIERAGKPVAVLISLDKYSLLIQNNEAAGAAVSKTPKPTKDK